ncbi:hypothetical protein J6590_099253 [Homalodisca vitripennis]|nr:hypothetical protein J6590_099253 [Homalodisca vitripennis]
MDIPLMLQDFFQISLCTIPAISASSTGVKIIDDTGSLPRLRDRVLFVSISKAPDEATGVGTSSEFVVASRSGFVVSAGVVFFPVDAWNAVVSPAGELIDVEDLDGVALSAGSGPGVDQAGGESDAGGVGEAASVVDRVLDSGDKSERW